MPGKGKAAGVVVVAKVVSVVAAVVLMTHVQTVVSSSEGQQQGQASPIASSDHQPKSRVKRGTHSNRDVMGFNAEDKKKIVDLHNRYRSQAGASDMNYMYWDEDLAKLAQWWVGVCLWNHSKPEKRKNIGPFSIVGENLAANTHSYDPQEWIGAWYDEWVDYNYDTLHCTPGKMCGHYTQVVWAESYAVGCGVQYCQRLRNINFPGGGGFYMSCNYGPTGNWRGEKPFTKGKACSLCGKDAPFCVQKMCAKYPVVGNGDARSRDQPFLVLIGCSFLSAMLSIVVVTLLSSFSSGL